MKTALLFLLAITLSITLKAQQSPREAYDVPPHFTENSGDFNSYIVGHVKKPETITNDVNGTVAITILVDSTGNVSVLHIRPKLSPEIYDQFVKAVATAQKWIPAKLKGKAVNYLFTSYFDIEVNKAASTMITKARTIFGQTETVGDPIYNAVEVPPSFPGGQKAMDKFIDDTMVYPALAKARNVTGRVFIQFVVEKDGSLSDLKILRDPGLGLGQEAVRILKLSPKWNPGIYKGKIVRVQFTVPVNFSLY